MPKDINVTTEIGTLKRLLVHSPDGGIGKVVPIKAQAWLYEDIVDLKSMQAEYDYYKKLLMAYLDIPSLKKWFEQDAKSKPQGFLNDNRPNYVQPSHPDFIDSDNVVEIQKLLSKLLENEDVKQQLVATICGTERVNFRTQQRLLNLDKRWLTKYNPITEDELAKVLITGFARFTYKDKERGNMEKQLFPPIPNFIFTRDIGIVVNDYLLLSKLNKPVRQRESILVKYIAHFILFKEDWQKIIELYEDDRFFLYDEEELEQNVVTIEGGDVMMVHPNHLLIGCSERTTPNAINKLVKFLFDKKIVKKVTAIVIPSQRETMHIDTVFTQIKRNSWVIFGPLSSKNEELYKDSYVPHLLRKDERETLVDSDVRIVQFINKKNGKEDITINNDLKNVEELFTQISREDFKCKDEMEFIYCGNLEYPNDLREQWTDACNLVALKEGVVIGYDRNRSTAKEFMKRGYNVILAKDIINQLYKAYIHNPDIDLAKIRDGIVHKDTLILLPSTELSRARGGSHCMSMPLLRTF